MKTVRTMAAQYLAKRGIFVERFETVEELLNRPFVLTKEDLRKNYPLGFGMVPRESLFQYHESFGTTGRPTAGVLTKEDFRHYVDEIRLADVGFRPGDMVLVRYPYAVSVAAHIFHHAAQAEGATVIPCSSRTTITPYPRVLGFLEQVGVSVICAMPTEAILIAEYARSQGRQPDRDFPALRAICVAGELLPPGMKAYLESLWNVPVFNFYGATEAGNIAYTCVKGGLHVASDYFLVDVVDLERDTAGPPRGAVGDLIVTSLRKEAIPLLRYRIEDIGYLREGCACGQASALLVHYGRRAEYYMQAGRRIYHRDIKDALFHAATDLGLSPFWRCARTETSIRITIEKRGDLDGLHQYLAPLGCRYEVVAVEPGTVMEKRQLDHVEPVRKPSYFS